MEGEIGQATRACFGKAIQVRRLEQLLKRLHFAGEVFHVVDGGDLFEKAAN